MTQHAALTELHRLNHLDGAAFVAALGAIFEHSPWVAEAAAARRPFADLLALHTAMVESVRAAPAERQLALIAAHPELAGQEASQGKLTAASSAEQARLGLTTLTRAEFEHLSDLNRRYRARFGFPAIVALVQHADRQSLFAAIEQRLNNDRNTEIGNALGEIAFIARGRLARHFAIASARLSTHVLDTVAGVPGADIQFALSRRENERWIAVTQGATNAQGRTDRPLLADIAMVCGRYRLEFRIGDYFRRRGVALDDPAFLDIVPIEFAIADPAGHYHVPLLCTPWSYSTYRGS